MTDNTEVKSMCIICTEKYTSRLRVPITCPFCVKTACHTCVTTYLLSSPNINPQCMFTECKKEWSFEFVASSTQSSFHNNKYRDYRASLLIERERSLLPQTQHLVVIKKKEIEMRRQIRELEKQNRLLKIQIEENKNTMHNINQQIYTNNNMTEEKKEPERRQFIRPCPVNECKGYLSVALKCGLCEGWACKDCHRSKKSREDIEHVCNKDEVATIKMLVNDTKPCPKCKVPIYKIEGCDQMWCTECKTPFEWTTLRIVDVRREVVHNPHYYQYQRDQNGGVAPRNVGDFRCGGLPTFRTFNNKLKKALDSEDDIIFAMNSHQLINHINAVVLVRHMNIIDMNNNDDLRLKYLLDYIDEKKWTAELKKREKKREKDRSLHMIFAMLVLTLTDLISNIIDSEDDQVPVILVQMEELREYVNKELMNVEKRFKNTINLITENWTYY